MKNRFTYIILFLLVSLGGVVVYYIQKEKNIAVELNKLKIANALKSLEYKIILDDLKFLINNNVLKDLPDQTKEYILSNTADFSSQKEYYLLRNQQNYNVTKQELLNLYWANSEIVNKIPLENRLDYHRLKLMVDDALEKQNISIPFKIAVTNNNYITKLSDPYFNDLHAYEIVSYPLFNHVSHADNFDLIVGVEKNKLIGGFNFIQIIAVLLALILFSLYLHVASQYTKLVKVSDIKNDFINNITHEFKTPVASIKLASDFLSIPSVQTKSNQLMHYVNIIKQENTRLLNQIEKLLTLSKMEQNSILFNMEEVDMHAIIADSIKQLEILFQEKNAKVITRLHAQNAKIKGDAFYLQNLFINLLDNALKYSDKTPLIEIISYNNENKELVIEFKDNGIGMDAKVKKHIFDKFYRRPTGDIHNIRGHGIGLTFVKQIIDKHKAKIYVDSKPGKGTTFTIYFKTVNPNYKTLKT